MHFGTDVHHSTTNISLVTERKEKELYISASNWGHCHLRPNQIKCRFLRRGGNRTTREKTSWSRVENQQTQPTYDGESRNRTRAALVGDECSHYYATTAIFNVDCHLLLLPKQLQAYKQASIKHTQAKEELAVSFLQTLL